LESINPDVLRPLHNSLFVIARKPKAEEAISQHNYINEIATAHTRLAMTASKLCEGIVFVKNSF